MASAEPRPTPSPPGPASRLLPGTRTAGDGEVVRGAATPPSRPRWWSWTVLATTVLAGVAGAVLLTVSARLDAHGAGRAVVDGLFWLGLAVAVLPATAVVLSRHATAADRWAALVVVAVVTVVPAGLRAGGGPVTWDDLVAATHLARLRDGAPLFLDRVAPAVADQPGFATLTVAVWRVGGLTIWQSALVVVLAVHVVAVLGVRALGRALGFGDRAAVAAALLWTGGPGVLVASSRVGGSALALALGVWALTAVVQAATSATRPRRAAWAALAVGFAAVCATTDVTAAWALVGATLLFAAVTVGVTGPPVSGRAVRRAWWPAAAGVLAVTAGWSLTPAGRRTLGALDGVTAALHRTWAEHAVPGWTVGVAGVAGALALGLAALGVTRLQTRLGEVGPRFALLGAGLFALSLLGLASPPTTTLAHTVWPLLAALLAPLAAVGLVRVWDLGARRSRGAAPDRSVAATVRQVQRDTRAGRPATSAPGRPSRRERRVPTPVAATAGLLATAVLVAGGVGVSVATDRAGSTAATTTSGVPLPEVVALSDRLAALAGPGARVVIPDAGIGEVVLTLTGVTRVPSGVTPAELVAAHAGWLLTVVAPDEDTAALARAPWLVRVAATPHLALYRLRPALGTLDVVPVTP